MSPVNMTLTRRAGLRLLMLTTVCSMLLPQTISAQPANADPKAANANPNAANADPKAANADPKAANASPKAANADPRAREARRHFKQGREFLDVGAYSEAIAEFETTLSLAPLPELLFNIAQAYRLKGDAKHALEMYKRFVEATPDGQIADEARAHIAALTKQISDAKQEDEARAHIAALTKQISDAKQETEAIEVAQRRHDTEREEQTHRRRIGYVSLGVGIALFIAGIAFVGPSNEYSTRDDIAVACWLSSLVALPYGTIKILYNLDPGPFKPTPTIAKGAAFSFSF